MIFESGIVLFWLIDTSVFRPYEASLSVPVLHHPLSLPTLPFVWRILWAPMYAKAPSMWGNPDADIKREMVQLLRERIEQGLFTIFIKMKDPINELADRWADQGREFENIRWSLPTNRPIFSWIENRKTHRSPMNPTVKKRLTSKYLWRNSKLIKSQQRAFWPPL